MDSKTPHGSPEEQRNSGEKKEQAVYFTSRERRSPWIGFILIVMVVAFSIFLYGEFLVPTTVIDSTRFEESTDPASPDVNAGEKANGVSGDASGDEGESGNGRLSKFPLKDQTAEEFVFDKQGWADTSPLYVGMNLKDFIAKIQIVASGNGIAGETLLPPESQMILRKFSGDQRLSVSDFVDLLRCLDFHVAWGEGRDTQRIRHLSVENMLMRSLTGDVAPLGQSWGVFRKWGYLEVEVVCSISKWLKRVEREPQHADYWLAGWLAGGKQKVFKRKNIGVLNRQEKKGLTPEDRDAIIQMLTGHANAPTKNQTATEQIAMAWAIGQFLGVDATAARAKNDSCLLALERFMRHKNPNVRAAALLAFGNSAALPSLEALGNHLQNGNGGLLEDAAAFAGLSKIEKLGRELYPSQSGTVAWKRRVQIFDATGKWLIEHRPQAFQKSSEQIYAAAWMRLARVLVRGHVDVMAEVSKRIHAGLLKTKKIEWSALVLAQIAPKAIVAFSREASIPSYLWLAGPLWHRVRLSLEDALRLFNESGDLQRQAILFRLAHDKNLTFDSSFGDELSQLLERRLERIVRTSPHATWRAWALKGLYMWRSNRQSPRERWRLRQPLDLAINTFLTGTDEVMLQAAADVLGKEAGPSEILRIAHGSKTHISDQAAERLLRPLVNRWLASNSKQVDVEMKTAFHDAVVRALQNFAGSSNVAIRHHAKASLLFDSNVSFKRRVLLLHKFKDPLLREAGVAVLADSRTKGPLSGGDFVLLLNDSDSAVRIAVFRRKLYRKVGPVDECVRGFRIALSDKHRGVRLAAAEALGASGAPNSSKLQEILIKQLRIEEDIHIQNALGRAIRIFEGSDQ